MEDMAQSHRDAVGDEKLNQGAATGWDPYQVWLTRIRPQQCSIEPAPAQSAASQHRWRATRVRLRFHWRSS
jgi:hypothetical protein